MADVSGLIRPPDANGGPPAGAHAAAVSVLMLHENEAVVEVRVQRRSPAGLVILGTSRQARFKDVGFNELLAMLAAVGDAMQAGFTVPDPDEPGKLAILWMPVSRALFRLTPAPGSDSTNENATSNKGAKPDQGAEPTVGVDEHGTDAKGRPTLGIRLPGPGYQPPAPKLELLDGGAEPPPERP